MTDQDTGEYVEAAAPVAEDSGDNNDARQVPLDALEAERSQRQQLQEELRLVKDNIALMQANQPRQEQPKSEFDSLQDDDVLTVGEAKKFITQMNSQHNQSLEEIKINQRHPDYTEVVTKYLPEVIKSNPNLRDTLQKSQDFELAYYLAKQSDSYKKAHKKQAVNADAERIVQNSQSAGSLSSVGQNSPISEARRWKEMSDDDFKKTVNQNMGYF